MFWISRQPFATIWKMIMVTIDISNVAYLPGIKHFIYHKKLNLKRFKASERTVECLPCDRHEAFFVNRHEIVGTSEPWNYRLNVISKLLLHTHKKKLTTFRPNDWILQFGLCIVSFRPARRWWRQIEMGGAAWLYLICPVVHEHTYEWADCVLSWAVGAQSAPLLVLSFLVGR